MSRELLASQKNNLGIFLDPRTKLAVLITIAVFILGGSYEGIMQYYIIVLAAIPLLLLSAARKWKGAVLYILIFGGSLCLEMFGLSRLTGVANYIAVAVVGILLRFTPSVVMGYFVVTTTTVSEFVAAMERLHLPQQITIPMSVMFRFFPTVAEEWSAIGDAMRMRGVRFGGGKASAILEYRIVPMMICSVKIGEELSQAALTRGLGGPVKRTNICKLGFHVQDVQNFFIHGRSLAAARSSLSRSRCTAVLRGGAGEEGGCRAEAFAGREALAEEDDRERHDEYGREVVDEGGGSDGGAFVGLKEQHPIQAQKNAGTRQPREIRPYGSPVHFSAEEGAGGEEKRRSDEAAAKHDDGARQLDRADEESDGAEDQHGGEISKHGRRSE